jgi:uncharacterized membrane protein YkoI
MVQKPGGNMNDKLKRGLLVVGAVAALAGGGAAIAGATGNGGASGEQNESNAADEGGRDDGNGTPVTGSEFDRASAVALDAAGGGKVSGSEKHDEEGYYEIEVTRDDGTQVDVHLDRNLNVIDASPDG